MQLDCNIQTRAQEYYRTRATSIHNQSHKHHGVIMWVKHSRCLLFLTHFWQQNELWDKESSHSWKPPTKLKNDSHTEFQTPLPSISKVHQPFASVLVTNDLEIHIPTTQSIGGEPMDSDLDCSVQSILLSVDLNSVTKREIRRKLEDHFGIDLTSRKAAINQAIDRILLSHAQ